MRNRALQTVEVGLVNLASQLIRDKSLHLEGNSEGVHACCQQGLQMLDTTNNAAYQLTSIASGLGQM